MNTIQVKKVFTPEYIPQLSVLQDKIILFCNHVETSNEQLGVGADESELITVCDVCDAQLIGGEWL